PTPRGGRSTSSSTRWPTTCPISNPSVNPSGYGRDGSTASSTGTWTTPALPPHPDRRPLSSPVGAIESRRIRVDFTPDPEQQAVAAVVTSVLDRDNSWDALVAGGVTALAVPERLGGDGLGLAEIATALTEIGRHGTISPALATLGLGTAVLLDLASDAQQDRYLRGVAKGSVLTAALNEPGAPLADRPATTLANGRLNGTKVAVPYAEQAEGIAGTPDSAVG